MLNPAPCVGCTHQAGFTENSPMLCISVSEFLEQLVFRQRSVPEADSIDLNHYYEGGGIKQGEHRSRNLRYRKTTSFIMCERTC